MPTAPSVQQQMHGYANTPDRLSFASSSGHSGSRQSVASLPPRSRRPASIVIANTAVLPAAASPRYSLAMPSVLPPAAHNDESPSGSYAYRRRGSSILGNSGTSSSGSSITSPALPTTPNEHSWAGAAASVLPQPPHFGYAAGHVAYNRQSPLQRNNTTKTVSHNDLAPDQPSCPTTIVSSAGHIRHLSPSRSATFATSASSPHAGQRHAYGYQSPARDSSSCTLVDQAHDVTMIQRKSEGVGKICDDVDVVVPNVCAVGKQHAYLPPRTANLSITN
ncbi:hypothetical protein LPJ60_000626 [Coemansia sp. RSA 2675]|nr:hypothetical protein LPJ60_000626 [Coemansia sp. RSA 2675]